MIFLNADDEKHNSIYLGEYHAYKILGVRNPNFDDFSRLILDLKDKKENAIEYFHNAIKDIIGDRFSIAMVPSHDPDAVESGIYRLAKRLVVSNNLVDATECLQRHTKIKKLAGGGSRDKEVHLKSIRVTNPHLIKGRKVLIIDDVTTSGGSLEGCKTLLEESGAAEVKCLALAQTVLEG